MSGVHLDLSANGDGIDNQTSIEGDSVFANNDTFQAADTMSPLFVPIGSSATPGTAISFSRGSEPSLKEERVMFRYRSVSMGFGLEGVNSTATQDEVTTRTLHWLLDELTVTANAKFFGRDGKTAIFHAVRGVERRRLGREVPMGLRRPLTDRDDHESVRRAPLQLAQGPRRTRRGDRQPRPPQRRAHRRRSPLIADTHDRRAPERVISAQGAPSRT